jgi:HD domain
MQAEFALPAGSQWLPSTHDRSTSPPHRADDWVNALEVLQRIIERHDLQDETLTLVSHRTSIGWRVRHPTAEDRIERLSSTEAAADDRRPRGARVQGRSLLRFGMRDLDGYRSHPDHVVSISSRLGGARQRGHLALMDLHLDEFVPPDRLRGAIRALCEERAAWLLRTDRHYHVYGDFLLDQDEWMRWNVRFQMSLALADARYVGHSLLWGCNLLRLNAGALHQIRVPSTQPEATAAPPGPLATAAVQLAQRRHTRQLRRGGGLVVEHLREVAEQAVAIHAECAARGIGLDDVTAEQVYACGYLHDCLEDTNTDFEDVVRVAGARVAYLVGQVSMDKRLPMRARRAAYNRQLARASLAARIVKLADLLSNLRGLTGQEGRHWILRYLRQVESHQRLIRRQLVGTSAYNEARDLIHRWRVRLRQSVR